MLNCNELNELIETLEFLISEDCTDTQFDYADDIETAIKALKELLQYKKAKPIFCGACDRGIFEFDKFCSHCGRKLGESNG